uniref:Uncharacterized protein n=1 Tax=Theileria annulata TaxID=5874 RepID=A0A3B0MMA3_THEAN
MSIVSIHNYKIYFLVYILGFCTILPLYRRRTDQFSLVLFYFLGCTHFFTNAINHTHLKPSCANVYSQNGTKIGEFDHQTISKTQSNYSLNWINNDVSMYREFSLLLKKRSRINRFNKEMELFRRVRERRKKFNDRFVDIRKINFRNSRCNLQLLRLPVSPLVDLNSITPFKTVLNMREEIPFNPTPMLKFIGFRFKPLINAQTSSSDTNNFVGSPNKEDEDNINFYVPGKRVYDRFCKPYPMDRLLEVMDARSCGYYSRLGTPFKITGESDSPPTPMDGKIVPPGGSVGRGSGFGLTAQTKEPKRVPISQLKFFEDDEKILKFEELFETVNDDGVSFKIPLDQSIKDPSFKELINRTFPKDVVENFGFAVLKLPYLDDVCEEGDIFRNPRYLGEYRYKYWFNPFYGSPSLPCDAKKLIEEYNEEHPDDKIDYEKELLCDLIYCHSNGTIVELRENVLPFDPKTDDVVIEGEDPREPRFVVHCDKNYIKEHNLKKGQIFDLVDEEHRRLYYDNIFFQPKCFRHPIHLPDGSLFYENFIPKQRN